MSAPRRGFPGRLIAGLALALAGVVSWLLYTAQADDEAHSFTAGRAPAQYVRVEAGHTYWISVPGGVATVFEAGIDSAHLQCTAAAPGQAPGALNVAGENGDTKLTDRIGSFVAGRSGRLHIECGRLGAVYVDNAAGAGFDWSGFWLVVASLSLVAGLPLTLSGLRSVRTVTYSEG